MNLKRWRRSKLYRIPEQHEPGKQPGFMAGKKHKKAEGKGKKK